MMHLRRALLSAGRLSRQLSTRSFTRNRIISNRSNLLTRFPAGQSRGYVTIPFVPKTYFFRLFWTVLTGTVGVISYKVSEASNWAKEKGNLAMISLMSLGLGVVDSSTFLRELIDGMPNLMQILPKPKEKGDGQYHKAVPLLAAEDSEDESSPVQRAAEPMNENFRHFIRKMIEIRNILRSADLEEHFELPSIVVIGSQSSGKSSVLESIVGHQFLPKGQNMVTRRPLELTLVHSPETAKDYGVFTDGQESSGPIADFGQIQEQLTRMNLDVPDSVWVSDDPIRLTVYSKNVPDLTLVDLPGYIQMSNKKQPPVLREKISQLCERYIEGTNNIILAVCPADVDLANAEALKASHRVDPKGERTIGVITKLDLVDPSYGASLIRNDDYPLKLGYIGVVCKTPSVVPFKKPANENIFFAENAPIFAELSSRTGIKSLRSALTGTLEYNMAARLGEIMSKVQEELSEVRYQLKAEFNDRLVTPEGYVTGLLTHLKAGFERLSHDFSRSMVKEKVSEALRRQLIQVVEQYLAEPELTEDEAILEDRFRLAVTAMTRTGVGKKTIEAVVVQIIEDLESQLSEGPLASHPQIKSSLLEELSSQLKNKSRIAADSVENALKPYKHDLEFSSAEWSRARTEIIGLLADQVRQMTSRIDAIQHEVGQKKLRKVIQYLATHDQHEFEQGLSDKAIDLLGKGREVAELNHRAKLLRKRLEWVSKDSTCDLTKSQSLYLKIWSLFSQQQNPSDSMLAVKTNPCIKKCPEVYLYLLHSRLLEVSALFVHHELVHEFLDPLPSLVLHGSPAGPISSLAQGTFDRAAAMRYVTENPIVARHIRLLERRQALERVREKLVYLKQRQEDDDRS